MTIGIAVSGEGAGLAVFRALAAVESVGRGAIGGFVSFAAIDEAGVLHRAGTQRGGSRTLFTAGERVGVDPPAKISRARLAVLMSSGPDRPEPLAQFTPADPDVGLVTGHRLPNMPGVDGVPINERVLARMADGDSPQTAVREETSRNPEADAGVIALDRSGRISLANTDLVAARSDGGAALVEDRETGVRVGVLHNSIFPHRALADLAVSAVLDSVMPADRIDFEIEVRAGTRVELGAENCLHLAPDDRVSHITVVQRHWLAARHDGAVMGYGAPVRRDGKLVGRISFEPYCVVENGRLLSMSGRERVLIGVRTAGS